MRALEWLGKACAAVSLVLLLLLLLSGWGLMGGYAGSKTEAFASVLFFWKQGGAGALLRSLHSHAASGLVVFGASYLLTSYLSGALYRARGVWWLSLSLYLLVLGLCFTGFLLPMDQAAYWGTVVRLGIVETVPLAGPPLADVLRGGAAFNASTVPRFYGLHVSVLPVVGFLLLLPLLAAVREQLRGRTPPWGPYAVAVAALASVFLLASLWPAVLEPRADPADAEYVPRPEWYFLWLFQLRKYLEPVPWVPSLLLPLFGLGFLYALPLLRAPAVSTRAAIAAAWCLAFSALTGLARYDDRALAPKPSYEEARGARAAQNYRVQCAECHGLSGKGDGPQARAFGLEARDFTSAAFWKETAEERMLESIRNGRGEDMPAFAKKLDEEEIEALFAYLKKTFQPRGDR